VVRGGGYYNFARNCRVAERNDYGPGGNYGYIGFRIARSSVP
jgi:formylglycine-generating enzyme required for sulfatase activity